MTQYNTHDPAPTPAKKPLKVFRSRDIAELPDGTYQLKPADPDTVAAMVEEHGGQVEFYGPRKSAQRLPAYLAIPAIQYRLEPLDDIAVTETALVWRPTGAFATWERLS